VAIDPHQRYRKVQAETASPGQLVLMLYGGALRFLRSAEDALVDGDIEKAHRGLTRAQDIVFELIASLDSGAGEVAENLLGLYVYLYRRLTDANIRKDVEPVREALTILTRLDRAWRQVLTGNSARAEGYGRIHGIEQGTFGAKSA